MKRRDLLAFGLAAMSAPALTPRSVLGQSRYPDRPIRLVIPYPPGGVYDATGRPWAEKVKTLLGTIVVENIGGAGSSLGHRRGRPRAARRLHHPAGRQQRPRHQSDRGDPLALRSGQGLRADIDPGFATRPPSRSTRATDQDPERTDRLCQGQSRQAVLRVFRRGHGQSSDRRVVQVADRNRHRARALSRSGARDDGPDQRAHPDAAAERDRPGDRDAQGRQAADARGHQRGAASRRAGCSDGRRSRDAGPRRATVHRPVRAERDAEGDRRADFAGHAQGDGRPRSAADVHHLGFRARPRFRTPTRPVACSRRKLRDGRLSSRRSD